MMILTILEVVLLCFWFCGTTLHMIDDELCEEPKEMKEEGEGVVSGKETKKAKEEPPKKGV